MKTDSGVLYVVATPIGNIKDISLRALEILKSVEVIFSENTRETQKLLNKYQISTKQSVYTDQKHVAVLPKIIDILDSGKNVALLSDSGTPVISDPGYKLISELKKVGYNIVSIPGANAAIAALSISGLPTDKFMFLGFLPKSKGKRKSIFVEYGALNATLTLYESPYRLGRLLNEILEFLGNRYVTVAKDLTKVYESVVTGRVKDLIQTHEFPERGEYVVLIAKKDFEL